MIGEIAIYKNINKKIKDNENKLLDFGILTKNDFDKFYVDIEQKLSNFKPSLMVYGCYNAGKSTLINALFGKEVAKTSDIPETDCVNEYIYNGFSIYDTPGINAPIEHEEITTEHLQKSEIIVFVISNDSGFEEAFIYDKIKNIFLAKKPIIIVLNNKNSFAKDSEELNEQLKRIEINIKKLGIDECFYKVIAVNAKLAFEGKLIEQNELTDISNLSTLEVIISDILQNSGKLEVVNTLNLYIESFLKKILNILDDKNPDKEIAEIQKLSSSMIEQKRGAKAKANALTEEYFASIQPEIVSCIESQGDIGSLIDLKFRNFQNKLSSQMEDIQKSLGETLSQFSLSNIKIDNINVDSVNQNTTADFLIEKAVNFLDSDFAKEQIKANAEKATIFILKKTKEYLPELMKGKGSAWISKAAGRFAGFLAIATNGAQILYNRHKEIQEAEAAFQAEKKAKMAVVNTANNIILELTMQVKNNLSTIFDDLFDPIIKDFQNSLENKQTENNEITLLKSSINELFNELPIKN